MLQSFGISEAPSSESLQRWAKYDVERYMEKWMRHLPHPGFLSLSTCTVFLSQHRLSQFLQKCFRLWYKHLLPKQCCCSAVVGALSQQGSEINKILLMSQRCLNFRRHKERDLVNFLSHGCCDFLRICLTSQALRWMRIDLLRMLQMRAMALCAASKLWSID